MTQDEQDGRLLVGAGRSDITPPVGIPMGGWSDQLHEVSEGNDGNLFATAWVLRTTESVLWAHCLLDLCAVTDEQADAMRQAVADALGADLGAVHVSATHSHSAPVTSDLTGGWIRKNRHLVAGYLQDVQRAVVDSCTSAAAAAEPFTMSTGTAVSDAPVNRRVFVPGTSVGDSIRVGINEDGPVDRTVRAVRFEDASGKAIVTLVEVAAHPICLGGANTHVTPEYPGVVRDVVEAAVGGLCVVLQGAAGDLGTREIFSGDLNAYKRTGAVIGHAAASAALAAAARHHALRPVVSDRDSWLAGLEAPPAPTWLTEKDVAIATPEVELTVEQPSGDFLDLKAQAEAAEDRLYEAREAGADPEQIRLLTITAKRMVFLRDRAAALEGLTTVTPLVSVLKLGDVALVTAPFEMFTLTATAIRERSPFPMTLVVGYTDGYRYYLPRRADHAVGGYEVWVCPFEEGAAELLEEGVIGALERLGAPLAEAVG